MSVPTQAISAMASKYAAAATPGRPISPSLTPAAAALARRFAEPRPKPTPTATASCFAAPSENSPMPTTPPA